MPKMKTNRSAAKRFKKTKSGLFKRSKGYRRHLSASKSTKRQPGTSCDCTSAPAYWTTPTSMI